MHCRCGLAASNSLCIWGGTKSSVHFGGKVLRLGRYDFAVVMLSLFLLMRGQRTVRGVSW